MDRYQIKITLKWSKPIIWRRIIVYSGLPLEDFHYVIQTVMPWCDAHLHQFIKDGKYYSVPEEEEWDASSVIDYSEITISDLISSEGDKMMYEYDFGDGWRHDILLEKILKSPDSDPLAEFVDGENACPPEDCGGVPGYMHLLEVLHNPQHPDYGNTRNWLGLEEGEEFDPEDMGFDPEEINEELEGIG